MRGDDILEFGMSEVGIRLFHQCGNPGHQRRCHAGSRLARVAINRRGVWSHDVGTDGRHIGLHSPIRSVSTAGVDGKVEILVERGHSHRQIRISRTVDGIATDDRRTAELVASRERGDDA